MANRIRAAFPALVQAPSPPVSALRASIRAAMGRVNRSIKYRKTWRTPIGRDCISLNSSLCAWLAARLSFLAGHHHSYPSELTSEQWEEQLRRHAAVFAAYETHWDADSLEAENALIAEAQKSLRWVAKNLPTLWD